MPSEVSLRLSARKSGCCLRHTHRAEATSEVMGLSLRSRRSRQCPAQRQHRAQHTIRRITARHSTAHHTPQPHQSSMQHSIEARQSTAQCRKPRHLYQRPAASHAALPPSAMPCLHGMDVVPSSALPWHGCCAIPTIVQLALNQHLPPQASASYQTPLNHYLNKLSSLAQ